MRRQPAVSSYLPGGEIERNARIAVNDSLDTLVIRWHIRTLVERNNQFFGPEMNKFSKLDMHDQRAQALVRGYLPRTDCFGLGGQFISGRMTMA